MSEQRTMKRLGMAALASLAIGLATPVHALSDYGDVVATWLGNNATGRPVPAENGGVFAFSRNNASPDDDFAGVLVTNSPVDRFIGVCIEIGENMSTAQTIFTVRDLADAPVDSISSMGVVRAEDAAKLVTLAFEGKLANALLPAYSAKVLPFQVALWEITQDRETTRGSYSLSTGGYRHAANTIATDWLGILNDVNNSIVMATGLFALTHPDRQDQLVQVVPIPPAAWLLGSGLLGLFVVARRKTTST